MSLHPTRVYMCCVFVYKASPNMMAPVSYLSPLFVLSPFQVMRAGSIPIFVGDGYPLPLDDADGTGLIPWQRISLRVDGR